MSDTQQKIRDALAQAKIAHTAHDLNEHVESLLIAGNKVTCVLKQGVALDARSVIEDILKEVVPFKQVVILSTQNRPETAKPAPEPEAKSGINPAGIDLSLIHI